MACFLRVQSRFLWNHILEVPERLRFGLLVLSFYNPGFENGHREYESRKHLYIQRT